MSKQEKLAALIHRVREYTNCGHAPNSFGTEVHRAFREYESTPDDPPQPPEMPEVVEYLVKLAEGSRVADDRAAAYRVRDHYRQPLKIRVGGTYIDQKGDTVQVVWENTQTDSPFRFLCVVLRTASTHYYDANGVSDFSNVLNLVSEVAQ